MKVLLFGGILPNRLETTNISATAELNEVWENFPHDAFGGKTARNLYPSARSTRLAFWAAPQDNKVLHRHALLLVEDSSDDEALSLRAIKNCGVPCGVTVIRNGGEVVSALLAPETPVPDLIVLDFHLPGLNGLEILRELRKHEKTRHVPVVMLSALESDKEVAQCLDEGASSCVRKPTDPSLYVEHVGLIARYWLDVDRPRESDTV